jgi:hypothetical protein
MKALQGDELMHHYRSKANNFHKSPTLPENFFPSIGVFNVIKNFQMILQIAVLNEYHV